MTAVETRTVGNLIDGDERAAASGATFEKLAPATGRLLSVVARSDGRDVDAAVSAAAAAQPAWAARTVEARGRILRRVAQLLERDRDEIAHVVAAETGKSPKDVQTYIRSHAGADDVLIHQDPAFVPWLPFLPARIEIQETVDKFGALKPGEEI